MNRTCIVTGANGFIGSNLLRQLLFEGWDVVDTINTAFETFPCDLGGIDVVFHIGANSNTLANDISGVMQSNYISTKEIVDCAYHYGTKIVYASSAAVYGDDIKKSAMHDGSMLELFDKPENLYAWTKLLGEQYGLARLPSFSSLRYFNVYGPGESEKGSMASMAWHAWKAKHTKNSERFQEYMKEGRISLFEGNPQRDFVYVKDVVSATIAAANEVGGIYHVGTGEARLFEDLVKGMGVEYDYLPAAVDKPDGYQTYTRCDSNMWVPGWEPKFSLEEGTADYVNYLKFSGKYPDGRVV